MLIKSGLEAYQKGWDPEEMTIDDCSMACRKLLSQRQAIHSICLITTGSDGERTGSDTR